MNINEILEKVQESERRSIEENRFFLLSSQYAKKVFNNENVDIDAKNYFYDIFKYWDDYGSIPLELGQQLESLVNDKSIWLGIHRTGGGGLIDNNDVAQSDLLSSIFNDGLKIYGDLTSGAVMAYPNLSKTLSYLSSIIDAVLMVKTSYKNSTGGVLAAFPKTIVSDDFGMIKQEHQSIIFESPNVIKPEYLLGYISQDNGVCKFYPKDEFKKSKTI